MVPKLAQNENTARDMCREFGLRYPTEENGQLHVSGGAKTANPTVPLVDNSPSPGPREPCLYKSMFDTTRHIPRAQLPGEAFGSFTFNAITTQHLSST
ncbi:hypothetical protein MW887_008619 [Aspergillus wentii]|nr:hypothetical protein MW887_008619 [Aspergillus wentii]